ncbi:MULTISPECIES: hypothetical protein [Microbacterium]|uniref:hypothetical protein n=1 Tax=Microbacterium TaxID=33882 RepID=UPI000D64A4C6|nr:MULTISPECIES: hypothetical protein [Microbacterium]
MSTSHPHTVAGKAADEAAGVVMVEGLPGSGKSTNAADLAAWLTESGADVEHWPEGRADHPVDFENVSLLTDAAFRRIGDEDPGSWQTLRAEAEPYVDGWLIRGTDRLDLPADLAAQIRSADAYDGEISPDRHARALSESWRRYGEQAPAPGVQVWECVLIQNPVCAFVARFDRPEEDLAAHVEGLVAAVRNHNPMLVYLDPGDPEPVLRRVAAERPDWWLDFVIRYHTGQGYGLRSGLEGFDGYIQFMRMRRSLELDLLPRLDLPTLVIRTDEEPAPATRERIRAFAAEHLAG